MIISGSGNITVSDLPREMSSDTTGNVPVRPLKEAVFDFKKSLVRQALSESSGKKAHAAAMLGMPRSNFSRLLRQLGVI